MPRVRADPMSVEIKMVNGRANGPLSQLLMSLVVSRAQEAVARIAT